MWMPLGHGMYWLPIENVSLEGASRAERIVLWSVLWFCYIVLAGCGVFVLYMLWLVVMRPI